MTGNRIFGMVVMLLVLAMGCTKAELPASDGAPGESGSGLSTAITSGNVAEVGRILDAQPDLVDEPNQWGGTPLHTAAAAGNAEIVKLLLDRGADPMALDDEGTTPADVARNAGASQAIIDLLSSEEQ